LVGYTIGYYQDKNNSQYYYNKGVKDGKRKQLEQDKYLYEKCYNYVDMWSK
jgi:hypothetical protein